MGLTVNAMKRCSPAGLSRTLGSPVLAKMKIDRLVPAIDQSVRVHAGDVSQDTHWDAYRPQDPSGAHRGPRIGWFRRATEGGQREVPRFVL